MIEKWQIFIKQKRIGNNRFHAVPTDITIIIK